LALASCSVKARATISAKDLEAKIAAGLASTFHTPKPAVTCPTKVPAQAGTKFTCTSNLYGQHLVVNGEVTGPRGNVEIKPAQAVIVASEAEAELARRLSATFRRQVSVACRVPALVVASPGRRFGCSVDVGTIQRQLAVTVTGTAGALSYRLLPYRRASGAGSR
jgi:hypothetical protein